MGPAPAWSPPTPWGWQWPSVPSMASGVPQTTLFAVWWWPWAGGSPRPSPSAAVAGHGPDHPGGRGRPAGDPAPDPGPAGGDELRDPVSVGGRGGADRRRLLRRRVHPLRAAADRG